MSVQKLRQVLLLVLLVCGGCGRTVTTTSSKGINWVTDRADAVPGIDTGSVDIVTIGSVERPLTFAFWCDNACASNSKNTNGVYERTTKFANGVTMESRCQTNGGRSVIMTIDEEQFDLTNGAVFLVAASDGDPRVLQLDRGMEDFPTDKAEIQSLAKNDEQIREFFNAANASGDHNNDAADTWQTNETEKDG